MKLKYYMLIVPILISLSDYTNAQTDIINICKIENGSLIFNIDTHWTEKEKKEISEKYLLDSTIIENAIKRIPEFTIDSVVWKTEELNYRFVKLYKNLEEPDEIPIYKYDMFDVNKPIIVVNPPIFNKSKKYGINNFTQTQAFSYSDSIAKFFIKEFPNAKNCYISGTFNDWSTLETPMQKCDSGWVAEIKLPPGKYVYKYIIDGIWTLDPANNLKETDENGILNSVVYVYNHLFKLNGYKNARKVKVTGGFTDWRPKGIVMHKTSEGWELPLFFNEGTYSYKYIVDGSWLTDTDNPLKREDSNGNLNSYFEIGNKVIIKLKGYLNVQKMIISGSFNNWDPNELPMEKTDGGWQLSYVIGPGNYEYKYIADGTWMTDSINPFTIFTGGFQNSVFSVNPNHTFILKDYPEAKQVIVTGNFNNWNTSGYTMSKQGDNWVIPLFLYKGKYLYKFIVDGQWIVDPDNPIWENNEVGTGNSVLWIK